MFQEFKSLLIETNDQNSWVLQYEKRYVLYIWQSVRREENKDEGTLAFF